MDGIPTSDALLAHTRFLRALATGLLHDEHAAEDVVQETWVRALRRPPRGVRSLRAWLARITRNLATDRMRAESARRGRERATARGEAAVDTAEMVARYDLQRRLAGAVRELDEPYRTAVLLRYFEGLAPQEIARRQGLPAATVRTHLHRGLQRLRADLDGEYGDRRKWSALLLPLCAAPASLALPLAAAALLLAVGGAVAVGVATTAAPSTAPTRTADTRPPAAGDAPAPPVPAVTAEPAARTLRGRVLGPDGAPAEGARVRVWRPAEALWPRVAPAPAVLLHETRSGPEGAFRLDAPGGDVRVDAATDAARSPRVPFGDGDAHGIVVQLHPSVRLAVRVVDDDGAPVAGAVVRVGGGSLGTPVLGDRTTDPEGRAVFPHVVPTSWGRSVTVRAAGYATAHRFVPTPGDAVVHVTAERTWRGTVVDADGRPVADARVAWIPRNGSYADGAVRADARGRFRCAGLPDDVCVFFVDAGARGRTSVVVETFDRPGTLALPAGHTLRGRVAGPDGRPVAGLRLIATSPDTHVFEFRHPLGTIENHIPRVRWTVRTGADGAFVLGGVGAALPEFRAAAPYTVRVAREDPLELVATRRPVVRGRVVDVGGAPVPGARLTYAGGADWLHFADADGAFAVAARPGDDEVRLQVSQPGVGFARWRGAPDANDVFLRLEPHAVWRGRVVDADGRPVAGASLAERAWTDADGRFRLDAEAGPVRVQHPAYETRVLTAPEDPIVLASRPPRVVFRGVVAGPDGAPVAGAVVNVRGVGARTNARGRFVLPEVAAGVAEVTIHRPPFAPFAESREIVDERRHRFELAPGNAVAGRALRADGAPVPDATVLVVVGDHVRDANTDADGRFAVTGLEPGRVALLLSLPEDRAWAYREVDAGATGVELRVAPARALRGRLLDTDGAPVAEATVTARLAGAPRFVRERAPRITATTRADGSFTLTPLHGRRYRVVAAPGPGRGLVAADAAAADVVLRAAPGPAITGVVLGPDGAPVPDARVHLAGDDGTVAVRTGATGRFAIRDVAPGAYRVSASARYEALKDSTVRVAKWNAKPRAVAPGDDVVIRLAGR